MSDPTSHYGGSTPDAAAAPTPGPWTRNEWGHVVDPTGNDVAFRDLTIRMSSDDARMAEAEANTDLVAAAPETAAERDRLAKALENLVNKLEPWLTEADAGLPAVIKTLGGCANLHTAQRKATAVLAAARKPKSPEGVGGC